MARVCRSAIELLAKQKLSVGMIRPISVWPYPKAPFKNISRNCKGILVCEMSLGQMVDDVRIANDGALPVAFFGRAGGIVPEPEEVAQAVLDFDKRRVE
jgi:2-oxoglutarate ferredoxin oxidoreductase subunit alpha